MINEYIEGCGYNIGDLKPYVYLLPKSSTTFNYILDSNNVNNSYITNLTCKNTKKLNANTVTYTSNSSYSGRFSIESVLEININEVKGYQFDDIIDKLTDEYYVVFETKLNDYFILTVEFASNYIYTKQIGENNNTLTLTFQVSQNIPSLQIDKNINLTNIEIINEVPCSYSTYKVKKLRMSDMYETIISDDIIAVYNNKTIKNIDFIKDSVTYNETFDNNLYTYSISFKIPFKNYTNYLNYTLLEFTKNKYACYIYTNLNNAIAIPNLFPSYNIETSEDDATLNIITITLSVNSNEPISCEMTSDEMDKVIDDNDDNEGKTKWKPVYKYDQCIHALAKAHTLLCEYNFKGKPTGNYACLEGFSALYSEYNIIEEYNLEETKYGFEIYWIDDSCSFYSSCFMENLPNTITFNGNETKVIHVNSTCSWTLHWDFPSLWEITPTSGPSGEQDITFKFVGTKDNYGFPFIQFEDETMKDIVLIAYMPTNTRYIEDGTICSETPIDPDDKCQKWVDIEYNPDDNTTYICDKGNLYKKKQLYKSDKCDENFYATNIYQKGDLIEANAKICEDQGEMIWVEIQDEYICEEVITQ